MGRVVYKVYTEPVENLTTVDSDSVGVIASEVLAKLGGYDDFTQSLNEFDGLVARQGYENTSPYYISAGSTDDSSVVCDEPSANVIVIRNTGHKYKTSSTYGRRSTAYLKVVVGTEAYPLAVLEPGGAFATIAPSINKIDMRNIYVRTVDTSGNDDISLDPLAVEFFVGHVSNNHDEGILSNVMVNLMGVGV